MSFWNILKVGYSGLEAQRTRLDVISNNIANAETTRTEEGGAYKRKDVVFESVGKPRTFSTLLKNFGKSRLNDIEPEMEGVKVSSIVEDQEAGAKVYDPTHPDADEEGYVELPNVNMVVEMTNMISATRSYEASLSVVEAAKSMAQRALEIGR